VIAVAGLEFGQAPVLAGDDSPAQGRAAGTGHGEVGGAGAGCVVVGDFFAGRYGSPGCQGVSAVPPQVGIAAVIAVVVGLARGQDQVKVLGDSDRVDIRTVRLPGGFDEDLPQFAARDKAATQARD